MKPLIIANWKCNPTNWAEARKLFNKVKKTGAIICAPFVFLSELSSDTARSLAPKLGAQDCFWKEDGPYTGEISPTMLKSLRVAYVIIGHSERRIYFRETDEMINKKLKAALSAGLIPILCVGEKQGENAKKVIGRQLNKDLAGIKNLKLKIKNLIIAYEPVWAIGTGDFCPAEKAGRVCQFIRDIQNSKFKIQNSTILYGGSVNSKIAKDYINIGFDGLLVGGASLNAEEFIKIVRPV